MQWTPDENTPDLVYYQCYTHRSAKVYHDMNACKVVGVIEFIIFHTFSSLGILDGRFMSWIGATSEKGLS